MDTLFATKRDGKFSRSNNCCQLLITGKGYVYVFNMNSKIEVIQAVKNFSKEIGDPDAIIYNMAGENMPKILRKFCNDIGTTM